MQNTRLQVEAMEEYLLAGKSAITGLVVEVYSANYRRALNRWREASASIQLGANGQKSSKELFRGVDQGADDEATESGIRIGVRIGIAVGFLAVVGVFLFPLSTEFGGVHDDRGLFDRLCERRNSLLARGRKRTFIRMFDYISMRATVAGAHDNLIGGTEFARHGVEGMRESGSSHRVRQSSRTDRFAVRPPCC